MFKDNGDIQRSGADIYYALYNELYVVRSQANCMAHVFDKILNKNPHQIQEALSRLKCLSETDYSALNFIQAEKSSLPPYSSIPAGFRTCKIFEVKGKKVCLGTSYSEKAKLKYIEDLLLLCEESHDVFVYRIKPAKNALRVDNRYRQVAADPLLYYRLFNKEQSTNQSEFMARIFEECFKRKPYSIDWALENLDCLYEIDVNSTFTPKWKPIFRTQRTLHISGRELVMGTSLGLADKLNRINRYLRACGFDLNVYELVANPNLNGLIKLDSRQLQAVEAVLIAARNMKNVSELGYVAMVPGSGATTTILGTVQSLRAENPNRWAYLLVADTNMEKEQLIQQLNHYLMYYHEVESSRSLEKEEWEPDSISVATIQKFLPKDSGFTFPITFPLGSAPYTTDKPVMVILCNTRSLSSKSNMTALRSAFENGKYLAFCKNPPDGNEYGWFERCLYTYSLEQAVNDGLLLPIRIECKETNTGLSPFLLTNMIRTVMNQQDVRKGMIVCASIDMAEQYSKELSATDIEAYTITSNIHKNELDRAIKGFRQSQQAVAFVVDLWDSFDMPELDMIIVTRQLHSKALLLHLAAKVARPSPGKKFGKLVLYGFSEELLAAWGLPILFDGLGGDATLGNNRAIEFEVLFAELRNRIGGRRFGEAFDTLKQLRQLDTPRYRLLENDLAFLFLPESPLEENELHWRTHKEIVDQRATIWYALTGETQRDEAAKIPGDGDPDEPFLQEPAQPEQALPTHISGSHAQEIGDIFERHMKSLLEELLTTNGGGIEITEFRRQRSGTQFGFDLRCTYIDPDGQLCNCLFECKKVTEIHMADMMGKLAQARMSERPVNHWVLASPTARISNDLEIYLPRLEREVKEGRWEPVQNVQVWTPDQGVEELFALMPEIYDYYYPDGTLAPRKWTSEQREAVAAHWRKKLQPGLMLPIPWQRYLYNPANLLAMQEERSTYEGIYGSHVPIRCSGEDGIPISGTAEEYILDWLEQPTPAGQMPDTLFLLGDFGDGKSYLTYSLSRRLAERFVEAPGRRRLPLRLLLSDLQQGVTPQDFLRLRLDQFGANLDQWKTLEEKHRVLVILDGFDEMSSGMDLQTVEKNAVRLCAAVRFFSGAKVIVTSRYPVFQSVKEKLISYFTSPKVIRLLPIGFREKMDCLTAFAEKNNRLERLRRLCATHDVMGLASKPLFLDMMKSILLDEEIVEPDGISIYSSFSRATMERKVLFEREEILVNREETLGAVWNILEKYALILTQRPNYGITLEEFLHAYEAGGDESLARDIWQSLTEPTPYDEEDAGNRLTSRTLLKPAQRGYVFCHRSMQEYYTARGLCRLLHDQPQQARNYIMATDISYETTHFLAAMLLRMNQTKAEKAQQNLADMVTSTRNCAKDDNEAARLGATALNLYYAAWKQVPEIDWRGLVLNNAVLAGADLSGRDLSGTSLRYANLDNVNITGSNLSFCDLTGVRLDETKELLAVRSADEDQPYLYALYGNGILRKWKNSHAPQCTVISTGEQYTGIAMSYGGMMLYSGRQLCFSAIQAEGIVPQGGIHDLKDVYIYDINDKRLLYNQDGFLALYDLEACNSIFNGYPVEESAAAVLFDDNRVLVYRSRDSVRIVFPNAEGGWSFAPVEGLQDAESLITLATAHIDNETYLLCCGHSNGTIRLYCVTCDPVIETYLLSETDMAYTIRAVAFPSSQTLACAGQDGILRIFNITDEHDLHEITQFKSKILCKGCVVDGLEPRKHRERLLAYGTKSDC